ncbi:MAG TPA: hypothetical protein VHA10_14745 [Hypericibacter adhaerens]|jgi:hypothetical protein|uniref:Uncharacterized protein n=1 Tax=Hypericibacter adhaerens TaxID=2602016 RepID=A0A5J6MW24_9PROT|nr:hypothetical protein [Hypericibacter adhaerens]QEX21659.1 hypothetical protein FRZ61_15880 [Hypericibacter adhaerens]HWA44470.1 hypothetical protein [Hypericibacter adhaerens]
MRAFGFGLLAMVAAMAAAGTALAEDKVDCHRLDLAFPPADKAEWTECYSRHFDQDEMSADIETLIADIGTHVVHLTSTIAGPNTYFDKVPVSEKLRNYDELEKIKGLESEPGFGRYQIVRFQALLWNTPSQCFGFLKYRGATIGATGTAYGARGYVAGYDCWREGTPDRAQIEATLDAIDD